MKFDLNILKKSLEIHPLGVKRQTSAHGQAKIGNLGAHK